jgi:hypothetical protein
VRIQFTESPENSGRFTHCESVGCGTPTAAANRVALTACGPTNCFTTRALNAALYSVIGPGSSAPYDMTKTDADAPLMRQLF